MGNQKNKEKLVHFTGKWKFTEKVWICFLDQLCMRLHLLYLLRPCHGPIGGPGLWNLPQFWLWMAVWLWVVTLGACFLTGDGLNGEASLDRCIPRALRISQFWVHFSKDSFFCFVLVFFWQLSAFCLYGVKASFIITYDQILWREYRMTLSASHLVKHSKCFLKVPLSLYCDPKDSWGQLFPPEHHTRQLQSTPAVSDCLPCPQKAGFKMVLYLPPLIKPGWLGPNKVAQSAFSTFI